MTDQAGVFPWSTDLSRQPTRRVLGAREHRAPHVQRSHMSSQIWAMAFEFINDELASVVGFPTATSFQNVAVGKPQPQTPYPN